MITNDANLTPQVCKNKLNNNGIVQTLPEYFMGLFICLMQQRLVEIFFSLLFSLRDYFNFVLAISRSQTRRRNRTFKRKYSCRGTGHDLKAFLARWILVKASNVSICIFSENIFKSILFQCWHGG
jgi:hypothetical protein